MRSSAISLRVRYVECDMQGRVFNGHYLTWTDMAHTEALREHFSLDGGYQGLLDRGIDLVVAAAELQFRAPARFDDELVVRVDLEPPGSTSLHSRFMISRGEHPVQEVIAEATMVHVCVDASTYQKRPWPDWFRDRLTHS